MTSPPLHTNKKVTQRINYFYCHREDYGFLVLSTVIALNKRAISFPKNSAKNLKLSLKVYTIDSVFFWLLM